MELYGRILDDWNVVSSIQGTSKEETEKIWKTMYPSEPYELDQDNDSPQDFDEKFLGDPENTTKYDLISAVKRQTTFFYQVIKKFTMPCVSKTYPQITKICQCQMISTS